MPVELPIEVPRQADFVREITVEGIDNDAEDLTGATITWSARLIAGTGSVVASGTTTITDALNGKFEVKWHGPDFDSVGEPTEIVRVAHDCKIVLSGGDILVPLRGQLIIFPEVTA